MSDHEQGFQRFLSLCAQIDDAKLFDELLDLFLTLEERRSIGDRMMIVKDLLQGDRTQRQIAAEREVSIAKITRGSNSLKTISEPLRTVLLTHLVKAQQG